MTYGPHQHHNQSGHVVGVGPSTWKVDSIIRFIGPQKKIITIIKLSKTKKILGRITRISAFTPLMGYELMSAAKYLTMESGNIIISVEDYF